MGKEIKGAGRYTATKAIYLRGGEFADMNFAAMLRATDASADMLAVKKTKEGSTHRVAFLAYDLEGFDASATYSLSLLMFGGTEIPRVDISVVDADADTLDTLTYTTAPTGKTVVTKALYVADVTDTVRGALAAGKKNICFRFDATVETIGEFRFSPNSVTLDCSFGEKMAAYTTRFSDDADADKAVFDYVGKLVDAWFATERDIVYRETGETFELTPTDMSVPAGTHTVRLDGKGGNPVSPTGGFTEYRTEYARTVETLTVAGGYEKGADPAYDDFGGFVDPIVKGKKTGFFHTEDFGGRTYIIDPEGNPFFVVGVNSLNSGFSANQKQATVERFGSEDKYWDFITNRLFEVGVNTATGDASRITGTRRPLNVIARMSGISGYMKEGGLSVSTGGSSAFANNDTMNVFDPAFVTYAEEKNRPFLEKLRDNPHVVGFTSDNELPRQKNLLERYLLLDPTRPENRYSYAAVWTWLCRKLGADASLASLPQDEEELTALREEWKAFMFDRLFGVVNAVLRKYDPNHMYVGNRANGGNKTSEGYLRAAGRYCEFLTINMYDGLEPSVATIATIRRWSGRPFVVTEFYSKAADALDMNGKLLVNQQNAGWQVKTQRDRANYYENYTMLMLECRYCVGWVWYRFQDNDQTLYSRDGGKTTLRTFKKGARYSVLSFLDDDGNIVKAEGDETVVWQGETDTSNLGSNKGFFDDRMNEYTAVTSAVTKISKNTMSLVRYFDAKNH